MEIYVGMGIAKTDFDPRRQVLDGYFAGAGFIWITSEARNPV
jgi:hypothetical protein